MHKVTDDTFPSFLNKIILIQNNRKRKGPKATVCTLQLVPSCAPFRPLSQQSPFCSSKVFRASFEGLSSILPYKSLPVLSDSYRLSCAQTFSDVQLRRLCGSWQNLPLTPLSWITNSELCLWIIISLQTPSSFQLKIEIVL